MVSDGRVFKPIELTDNMSEEQIDLLAKRLHEVIEHGHGEIIITVTNRHVNQVIRQLAEKFPLPKRVR